MGEGYRPAPSPSRARAPSTRAPSSPLDARNARAIHARIRTPHVDAHRAAARALDDPESHDWPIQRAISHRPYTARASLARAMTPTPTTPTPHSTAHRSHQNPIHHTHASRAIPHARARRQSASFIHPSIHPSIANDYAEPRMRRRKTYHQRAARRGDARGLGRAMLHARAAKGQRAGRGERRGDGRDGGHRGVEMATTRGHTRVVDRRWAIVDQEGATMDGARRALMDV